MEPTQNPPSGGAPDNRPKTVRYNPSDPSSPGPSTRPSEGLRLDPSDIEVAPNDSSPLPSPRRGGSNTLDTDEAETYLGAPSVASSAAEFSGKDLDTQNLGVMLQDRYRLQRVLGKGGFGVVYLAHDRVLDQDVAIKVLKLGAANDSYKKRFIFEARTAAKLRHMAIVNVFDIVQTEGGLQLVMEYYPGGTMADLIKREGKVPPKDALKFIRQISLGLALAHRKGIIHRDIKPANIFFADDETVKLGDFGICASYDSHDHTMTGEVIGTPLYMAPEQQKDSKDVDPRADIYALGMTLYHMIVGRPPRVVNLDEVPERIRPLIQQSTAYDRKERPASCQQLVAMIDQILKTWDKADDAMRASSTQMLGTAAEAGASLSVANSEAPSGEAISGGPRAVSTRASDPIPPTGEGSWDPSEATQTQARLRALETGSTTVVHAPVSHWSMVALVGVIIAGFVAVIFMLVRQGGPAGGRAIADNGPPARVAPAEPADAEPPAAAPAIPALAGNEPPVQAAPLVPPAPEAEAAPPVSAIPEEETGLGTPTPAEAAEAAPVETWVPVQPSWAAEPADETAPGIENFLADQGDGAAADYRRETYLVLGDWVENRSGPTAAIFRESAEKRLRQALERFPSDPLYPYLLGRMNEASNRRDPALAQFTRARELNASFVRDFDSVILQNLRDLKLEGKISQDLRSFLLTPSELADRAD